MYAYGKDFYRLLGSFALRSAQSVIPKLGAIVPVRSAVDFGCGHGAWLRVWRDCGAAVIGVDGPYVDRDRLLIDPAEFRAADLAGPIALGRRFDLVQSLEVAEHLPPDKADQFTDTLVAHGGLILFSAAVPGQGGENHVNERPLEYWRRLFAARNYAPIDYLRPLIRRDSSIQLWYRCNMVLYAAAERFDSLPAELRACRVPDDRSLAQYWPRHYRLCHALTRRLPAPAINGLSRLKSLMAPGAADGLGVSSGR
ncbi:MAG: methyltransferase domain-containing protein [Alphaproteobacteria bacterium]|nr:methyltransferase domain-containing protein [Alphaproteobacteria bacterium]